LVEIFPSRNSQNPISLQDQNSSDFKHFFKARLKQDSRTKRRSVKKWEWIAVHRNDVVTCTVNSVEIFSQRNSQKNQSITLSIRMKEYGTAVTPAGGGDGDVRPPHIHPDHTHRAAGEQTSGKSAMSSWTAVRIFSAHAA